jgi:GMP synthase-like glutamine amidotransferase
MERDRIWYVTIDEADYFAPGDPRNGWHEPNLGRLRGVATPLGVTVEPLYMADLDDARLADDRLLALFGAGSFPEWSAQMSDPAWAEQLARYGERLRTQTRVPVLAVCGTHQLVAAAFGGWRAVGHMVGEGAAVVTVADELREGRGRIPSPRLGEVGVYPLRVPAGAARDPLLAGLPERPWFVQYHRDTVLPGHSAGFTPLLEPDPEREPSLWITGQEGHADPVTTAERCAVQALRHTDPDRLLYSLQFHPELPSGDQAVDADGALLLANFLRLAARFWGQR